MNPATADTPVLRVLHGHPSALELAVLLAVLAARTAGGAPAAAPAPDPRARWDRPAVVPHCAPSWRGELRRAA
ncbi:acyl-CoA carboxylase epsilon subunit [Kitasatospora sp. NPDC088134]|uniref:acyl-CoA carboxylase epsilon subunit n=1 Tax=Kitasatospora sp. NPDC088134 TaxID=3364071 RepID=UPI0037F93790